MPRGFFSRGARLVQRDKLLAFLIDNQAACRRDMGKERCHSLTTREAVAGFRTLPDKTLGAASKFVTEPTFPNGNLAGIVEGEERALTSRTAPFPKTCSRLRFLEMDP